ncbi:MAG: bifunctional methionine sulfoxide reductase B/A protein [Bacteroidetes bacterium]|nr:bifunctional methionine sulfoxide reductase B/A protein [Bacteroidota bacterium]
MSSIKFSVFVAFLSLGILSCAQSGQPNTNLAQNINDSNWSQKTDSFWKANLSAEQYEILRLKGTESPFSGKWLMHKDSGFYTCAACGNTLFSSDRKFDSECGWPSFDEEIAGGKIKTQIDHSHGMTRLEIMCARCGGHLGHLFDDGPTSTGKRYCVNSLSLNFVPEKLNPKTPIYDTLTVGGGCFWCIEAVFEQLNGVVSVESGYSGGQVANPTYREVCTGNTNHAEVVQIVFKPNVISLNELFKVFFTVHDPTTLNRQGADEGTQYRSIIFYRDSTQKAIASAILNDLNTAQVFEDPIVTELKPFIVFYPADLTHQDYYDNNSNAPYCRMVIRPKLEKLEKVFKDRLKP